MNENIKNWTIAGVIGTFVSIAIGIVLTIYFNREKNTSLEIKKVSDIELTRPLNVDRLSSRYLYDSIPVEHLWQSTCVIKNIGETTIYGEGFEDKNIRGDALKVYVKNSNNLLSLSISETNTDAMLIDDSIKFTQWRPNEYVELSLLSDGPLAPEISINDRDIKNVTISSVSYSPEEKLVPERFVDIFPRSLYKTLWWIIIVIESFSLLMLLLAYLVPHIQNKNNQEKRDTTEIFVFVWIMILIILPLMWMF